MKDYKKILEGVIDIISTTEKSDIDFANICTYIGENCPELKESEDERIRNGLIALLKFGLEDGSAIAPGFNETKEQALAWLEKQGDKDKLIKELGEYKVKYTQEVLEKHLNSMNNKDSERLRKTTIAFLKDFAEQGYENAVECIDWLEKQGEPFDDNIITRDDEILQAISIGLTDAKEDLGWSDFGGLPIEEIQNWLEKQGEQKPANEEMIETIRTEYEKGRADVIAEMQIAWSKEDEKILRTIISDGISGAEFDMVQVNWLKSLKDRYIWKPSDEQMKAIHDLNLTGNISYAGQGQELINLYNDLKKLK